MRKFAVAFISSLAVVFTLALGLPQAAASGAHEFKDSYPNRPAKRYNGNTPIELKNGLMFNNGTYGNDNPDYEAWAAAPTVVAGLSEQAYSFKQKNQFVTALKEQTAWIEAAIGNWKDTTSITRAEAAEYSKAAVASLSPALDKLKDATKKADGAGEKDWVNAESEARRALVEMRTTYQQMHKNVPWIRKHAVAPKVEAKTEATQAPAAGADTHDGHAH